MDSDLEQFESLVTDDRSYLDIKDRNRVKQYMQQIIDQCYQLFDPDGLGNCLNSLIKQIANIKDNQNYFRMFCFPCSPILYGQMTQTVDINKISDIRSDKIKDRSIRKYVEQQQQFYKKMVQNMDKQKIKIRIDLFILKSNSVQMYLMKELVDGTKGFIKQYSDTSSNSYSFGQLMVDICKVINQKVFYDLEYQIDFNDVFAIKQTYQQQKQLGIVYSRDNKSEFKMAKFNDTGSFFVQVQEQYMEEKRLRVFVQVVIKYYDWYQDKQKIRILNQTIKVNNNQDQIYQQMNEPVITNYYLQKYLDRLYDSGFDKQLVHEQSLQDMLDILQDYRKKKGYSMYQNLVFPDSIDTVPLNMHSISKQDCFDIKADFDLNSIFNSFVNLRQQTPLHRLRFALYPCLFELTQKKKQQKHFSSEQYNKIVSQHLFYRIQLKQLRSTSLNVWNNKVYLIYDGQQLIVLEGVIDDQQLSEEYAQFKQKLQAGQIDVGSNYNKNFMGIENIFRLVLEIYAIEQLMVDQVVMVKMANGIGQDRDLMKCFVEDKGRYLMSYSQYLVSLHRLLN